MTKITCALLCLSMLLSTSLSWAGDEICNGGDAIVCPRARPRLLDLFERQALYNLTPPLNESFFSNIRSLDINEVVSEIITPLEKLSPKIHTCLKTYLQPSGFWTEALLVPNIDLREIHDEQHYVLPKGCKKLQVAMQLRTPTLSGHRYLISQHLWDLMNDYHRAGLVLHEIILRNFILTPGWHENTTSVRYLTAVIMSAEASEMTPEHFHKILDDIGFRCQPMN